MIGPEELYRRTSEMQPLPMSGRIEDYEGIEKIVRKMTDGTRTVAGKIFRDRLFLGRNEQGRLIDKPVESAREITAYKKLKLTPLGIYVPEPYYLLQNDSNENVGLGVQWIEGQTLWRFANTDRGQLLTKEELDELKIRIIQVNRLGIYLDPEMFNASNIIIQPNVPQRIFFSECRTDQMPENVESQSNLTRELESHYVRRNNTA